MFDLISNAFNEENFFNRIFEIMLNSINKTRIICKLKTETNQMGNQFNSHCEFGFENSTRVFYLTFNLFSKVLQYKFKSIELC